MSDSPIIKILLAVVPIISAFLYLVGFSYYQGYLEGFGLEPSLFPITLDVTFFYGFLALAPISINAFLIMSFVVLIVILILLIVWLLLSTKIAEKFHLWLESRKKMGKSKKEVLGEKKIFEIFDFIENYFFKYIFTGFIFLVAMLLTSITTQKNGKSAS
jgi:hypothetical protein